MYKIFNNDKANSTAGLMAGLFFSLLFSSVVIAYFVTSMGYTAGIVQIEPLTSLDSYSSEQNFISGTYDLETLARTGHSEWLFYENVGLVLKTLSGDMSYLYIMNINPDSRQKIVNNYVINNSIQQGYIIVLKGNSGLSNNMILIGDNGLYTTYHTIDGSIYAYNEYFPLAGANKIQHVTITTEYIDGLKTCPLFSSCTISREPYLKVVFNGQEFTTTNLNVAESDSGTQFYGGIGSNHIGTTIEQFRTGNIISGTGESPDALTQVASFVSAMLAVITWSLPVSIMPLPLQAILIGTQETAFLICLVIVIIGG